MKNIQDVIAAKEKELETVRKDLYCLRETLRMLQDDEIPSSTIPAADQIGGATKPQSRWQP